MADKKYKPALFELVKKGSKDPQRSLETPKWFYGKQNNAPQDDTGGAQAESTEPGDETQNATPMLWDTAEAEPPGARTYPNDRAAVAGGPGDRGGRGDDAGLLATGLQQRCGRSTGRDDGGDRNPTAESGRVDTTDRKRICQAPDAGDRNTAGSVGQTGRTNRGGNNTGDTGGTG